MNDITLRPATENDIDLLYKWANDAEVRENSFSSKYIEYEEHLEWFNSILNDKNRRQYICEVDGQPVGQIRISVSGEKAMIGYSIAEEFRRQGYASQVLNEIKERAEEDFPQVQILMGEVKESNMGSRKAFLNSGYTKKYSVFEYKLPVRGG